jgi:hypothetical protein
MHAYLSRFGIHRVSEVLAIVILAGASSFHNQEAFFSKESVTWTKKEAANLGIDTLETSMNPWFA